ncbi:uncharacterized protein TNIN_206891 [Trichonephila inaurata madagascariensis]|uniref:Uncharacterized protein n=1 Tax=Trichonephila inaurata madagascariensis TaxID=2747483 RepID=A0A8X7CBE4_9ARAC|nr:uncharacterized protein TNIN_206891 [Trichonephila inaurata madagascariensis]
MGRDNNYNLRNNLIWFSFGVIDRLETARNFIHDEGWDIKKRLRLACKYCFKDDVQMLWRNMSPYYRFHIMINLPFTYNLMSWLDTLHRNIPQNWEEILPDERSGLFLGNFVGIRSYFPKLRDTELRKQCIRFALEGGVVHQYDLYSCISLLNSDELNSIRTRLQTHEFFNYFKCFLQWPFQIIFLDIANYFQKNISEDIFHKVVTFILTRKIGWRCQDHIYVEIFEPFWNLFPIKYKDRIKKKVELYALATYVLESSKDYDVQKYRKLLNSYSYNSTLE